MTNLLLQLPDQTDPCRVERAPDRRLLFPVDAAGKRDSVGRLSTDQQGKCPPLRRGRNIRQGPGRTRRKDEGDENGEHYLPQFDETLALSTTFREIVEHANGSWNTIRIMSVIARWNGRIMI